MHYHFAASVRANAPREFCFVFAVKRSSINVILFLPYESNKFPVHGLIKPAPLRVRVGCSSVQHAFRSICTLDRKWIFRKYYTCTRSLAHTHLQIVLLTFQIQLSMQGVLAALLILIFLARLNLASFAYLFGGTLIYCDSTLREHFSVTIWNYKQQQIDLKICFSTFQQFYRNRLRSTHARSI